MLQRIGLVALVVLVSVGLLAYTMMHQPRVFEVGSRTLAFIFLILDGFHC
jgi:hypothetical protein